MSALPRDLRPVCRCERCGILFTATTSAARFCLTCRYLNREGKSRKARYWRTPEREAALRARYDSLIRGRVGEIAKAFGWPRWAVSRWAAELGLTRPASATRRPWTEDEVALLEVETCRRTVGWLSRKLNRTPTSVVCKLKHLEIRRRDHDFYTMRDLELCLGSEHRVIRQWIERGWLAASRRGTDSPHDAWVITEGALRAFFRAHPLAFDLHRVDQLWFMDFVLGVDASQPAASPRAVEAA